MDGNLEIKKVDLWSLFKLSFLIYAFLGLLIGLFYTLLLLFVGSINSALFAGDMPSLGLLGPLVGLVAIPFIALLQGVFGSVVTTLCGWLYNLIAGAAGGLKVHAVEAGAELGPRSAAGRAGTARAGAEPDVTPDGGGEPHEQDRHE